MTTQHSMEVRAETVRERQDRLRRTRKWHMDQAVRLLVTEDDIRSARLALREARKTERLLDRLETGRDPWAWRGVSWAAQGFGASMRGLGESMAALVPAFQEFAQALPTPEPPETPEGLLPEAVVKDIMDGMGTALMVGSLLLVVLFAWLIVATL